MEKIMNKWIAHESNTDKDINLFCFCHSGGTAAYFATWNKVLEDLAIMPVQFPMREKRIREKLQASIEELAKAFVDDCIDLLKEKEFVFLGHCSGSIVAYEAAKYLDEKYNMSPKALFVSSCYAPKDYRVEELSKLSNDELLEVIKKAGFISDDLLKEPMMFEYFAKIAKSDFVLQESYVCHDKKELFSPIICMYGKEDKNVSDRQLLANWSNYTKSDFNLEEFEGSHFYLEKELEKVADVIKNYLK